MQRTRKKSWLRYTAYGVLTIVFFVLQSARLPGLTLWNGCADLMPFVVSALALYEGPYIAGSAGFLAGLLVSIHSPLIEGAASLYLAVFGIVLAFLAEMFFSETVFLAALGGCVCLVLGKILENLFYYVLVYDAGFFVAAPPMLGSLILSLPGGVLVCALTARISRGLTEESL